MEDLDAADARAQLQSLLERYRSSCLWYLRAGYFPANAAEALKILEQIERHGDVSAFQRIAGLKQWLSRHSSEMFVA